MTKPEIAKHLVQDVFMNHFRNEKLENFGDRHFGDDFSEDSIDMSTIKSTMLYGDLGMILIQDIILFSSDIGAGFSQYGFDQKATADLIMEIMNKNRYGSPHNMSLGDIIDAIHKKIHD